MIQILHIIKINIKNKYYFSFINYIYLYIYILNIDLLTFRVYLFTSLFIYLFI